MAISSQVSHYFALLGHQLFQMATRLSGNLAITCLLLRLAGGPALLVELPLDLPCRPGGAGERRKAGLREMGEEVRGHAVELARVRGLCLHESECGEDGEEQPD